MAGSMALLRVAVLAAAWLAAVAPAAAQSVNWVDVLRDLSAAPPAPEQSRVDPGALLALEQRTLMRPAAAAELPAPAAPQPSAGPAAETLPRGGRGVVASPLLVEALGGGGGAAAAAPTERERPPDLAAYGRLAEQGETMIGRTTAGVETFRTRLQTFVQTLPTLPASLAGTMRAAAPDGGLDYFLQVLFITALMLTGGRLTTAVLGPTVGRPVMVAVQQHSPPVGMVGKLPVLATRIVITALIVLAYFVVASLIGIAMLDDNRTAELTAGLIVAFYGVYVIVDAMWRMVLSPYLPEYRIPSIDDAGARRLYLWISVAAFVSLLSETVILWLAEIGAEAAVIVAASVLLRLVAVGVIIAMVVVNRAAIRSAILGGRRAVEANWVAAAAAAVTPLVVSVYFVAAWFEGSVRLILGLRQGLPLFLGPFVTLMVSLLVYAVATFTVEIYFRRVRARAQLAAQMEADRTAAMMEAMPPVAAPEAGGAVVSLHQPMGGGGDGDDDGAPLPPPLPPRRGARPAPTPLLRPRMRSFEDLGYRIASLLAASVGAYMMVRIWVGPGAFSSGGPLDWIDNIIDKLFIGYIAFHGVRIWLDQRIEEEGGDTVMTEPGDEGGGASASSRLGTLLPLFRSFVLLLIGLSVVVMVAGDFGVNLAPLFAGAGIVGIALGFGAQTLVRDILSGVFYLIDDAFRKGEYIDVGEVKGTVEKISLRSFQLRHHLGALNTIPFGEIKHLTNYSRDWVITKLPLRLTYDTDVDKVRKVIKKLGEELLRHPTEGHKFVQPLKSQGVYMMEDSAMILRVKFMTRPGDQWTTRKLVYQEIRNTFEKEGIKFAHKEVLVRVPGLSPDHPRASEIAGAAARRAIDEAEDVEMMQMAAAAAAERR